MMLLAASRFRHPSCKMHRYATAFDVTVHDSLKSSRQSLMEIVEKELVRSQRDNDLIYHKEVPAASSLPEIQSTNLARATVPGGLSHPEEALKSKRPLFRDLVGWGAREAISKWSGTLCIYLCSLRFPFLFTRHIQSPKRGAD